MKLRLSTGKVVELPSYKTDEQGNILLDNENKPITLSANERLRVVNTILSMYPEEFTQTKNMFNVKFGMRQDNNKLSKIRLDILGTYLIRSDEKYTKNVMSRYKEEKRPLQEMSFSQFNQDLVDINGWH